MWVLHRMGRDRKAVAKLNSLLDKFGRTHDRACETRKEMEKTEQNKRKQEIHERNTSNNCEVSKWYMSLGVRSLETLRFRNIQSHI